MRGPAVRNEPKQIVRTVLSDTRMATRTGTTIRRLVFARRTLAVVTASTLGLAGGGYYYLNSGPAYPVSTRETRRPPPAWTPPARQTMLDALQRSAAGEEEDVFDVLVVGGGATGAGVAVDAASRGLKVALVERSDFSSGASPPGCSNDHMFIYTKRDVVQVDQARSWGRALPPKSGDGAGLRAVQARAGGVARAKDILADSAISVAHASHHASLVQVRPVVSFLLVSHPFP